MLNGKTGQRHDHLLAANDVHMPLKKGILALSAYNLGDRTRGNIKGTGSQRQQTDNAVCAWITNKEEVMVNLSPHNYLITRQ